MSSKSRHCQYYRLLNNSEYDLEQTTIRRPQEIGSFSQDSKHQFIHDNSQLKHYCPPEYGTDPNFDLQSGFDTFIGKDDTKKEYIDDLLKWIQLNRNKFYLATEVRTGDIQKERLNTDFICWRGLLTRLLTTPYERRDGWIIAVTLFNGTFYMCEFDTEARIIQKSNMDFRQKHMTYWGHKFEQYVCAGKHGSPNVTQPVNSNEGFCSVVRSRLESHSLVYGGEVDCMAFNSEGKQRYVELKTNRILDYPRQEVNFKRFKLLKWWAQSYLIGINQVVCGFRDDDGIVHKLRDYAVSDMPNQCQETFNPWKPNICLNFMNSFLKFVKTTATKDDASVVYLFTNNPDCHSIECKELEAFSEYTFLPVWYTHTTGRPDT